MHVTENHTWLKNKTSLIYDAECKCLHMPPFKIFWWITYQMSSIVCEGVSVWLCPCMYMAMHIHARAHTCPCTYIVIHIHAHAINGCAHTWLCTHMLLHIHAYAHTWTCIYMTVLMLHSYVSISFVHKYPLWALWFLSSQVSHIGHAKCFCSPKEIACYLSLPKTAWNFSPKIQELQ